MATNTPQPPAPVAPPPAQPAAPAPQKKGTSPLVWILGGCGGLLVLAAIAFAVVAYWGVHKIKGYAESAKKNPAVFAAKLAVAANPDLEVVSSDDESGTVTIRNKKTGEEITMNAADIKNGRLKFKNEKGEEVTFEGSGEKGKEGFRIKSNKGSMAFGGVEAEKMPPWVPTYPGAKVMASTKREDRGRFHGHGLVSDRRRGRHGPRALRERVEGVRLRSREDRAPAAWGACTPRPMTASARWP